jgi:hypothetical protein
MELAGLEPATSWVRSRIKALRRIASVEAAPATVVVAPGRPSDMPPRKPFTVRNRYCLRPAVDAELGQDALDVRRDGLWTENELGGDGLLTSAVGEQHENVAFAARQTEVALALPAVTACNGRRGSTTPASRRSTAATFRSTSRSFRPADPDGLLTPTCRSTSAARAARGTYNEEHETSPEAIIARHTGRGHA